MAKEDGSNKAEICACCQEDISDELHHEFSSEDREIVMVCDSCYQEIGVLQKRNEVWVEYIRLNAIEYFIMK